jgi:IclR family acetate operon transcriptional repressor
LSIGTAHTATAADPLRREELEHGPALQAAHHEPVRQASHHERAQQVSAGIAAVLDVLDRLDRVGAASLSQLSRETGIPKSTMHRVCLAMAERGWVARERETGLIGLGPRAALIARSAPASTLISIFEPVAAELVAHHNETSCLTVLEGRDSVFIAKRETTHPVRLVTALGSRLPAFASASGRAMLAELPSEEIERLYAGTELVTPTGRRLGGLRELERLLVQVRARGFAESIDETALGLHCLAVPLRHAPGGAAITFCVPSGRMNERRRSELIAALRLSAATLETGRSHHQCSGRAPGRKANTA